MKQKVVIKRHGTEWTNRVMICPECACEDLVYDTMTWTDIVREGKGIHYLCRKCNCSFDVREKGHVKNSVKFRIALTFSIIFGFVAFCAWLVKTPYFLEDIGAPPTLFTYSTTVAFFVNLFFALYWGEAA